MSPLSFLTSILLLVFYISGVSASPVSSNAVHAFAQKRTLSPGCPSGYFMYQGGCQPITFITAFPTQSWLSCPIGWTWRANDYKCWPKTSLAVDSNLRTCYIFGHVWFENYSFCAVKNKAASSATSCDNAYQWYWDRGSLCCAKGTFTDEAAVPTGNSCPNGFYYTTTFGCVPTGPGFVGSTCPTGSSWDSSSSLCHGTSTPAISPLQCSKNQFWWPLGLSCISSNAGPADPIPDTDRSCPTNMRWLGSAGHCIPDDQSSIWPTACSDKTHTWQVDKLYCVGVTSSASNASQCSILQFFWADAKLCVNVVHNIFAIIPDSNKSCPLNFAWFDHIGHCIPNTLFDSTHVARCSKSTHLWDASLMYCKPQNASASKKRRDIWVVEE